MESRRMPHFGRSDPAVGLEVFAHFGRIEPNEPAKIKVRQAVRLKIDHVPHGAAEKARDIGNRPEGLRWSVCFRRSGGLIFGH